MKCPHSQPCTDDLARTPISRRWYDPLKKETNLNAPALQKWLKNGAQPSDTVKALLQKAFVIPPKPVRVVVPKDAVKMP